MRSRSSKPERLSISWSGRDGSAVVVLAGELDLETGVALGDEIAPLCAKFDRVVIDLGGVVFMDSSGLRSILHAQRSADSHGCVLAFRRSSPQVQRVFELTGVDKRLSFED